MRSTSVSSREYGRKAWSTWGLHRVKWSWSHSSRHFVIVPVSIPDVHIYMTIPYLSRVWKLKSHTNRKADFTTKSLPGDCHEGTALQFISNNSHRIERWFFYYAARQMLYPFAFPFDPGCFVCNAHFQSFAWNKEYASHAGFWCIIPNKCFKCFLSFHYFLRHTVKILKIH